MRLFIAIPFDEKLKVSLSEIQEHLLSAGIRGTYTKWENLHLTLAFIGEYNDPAAVLEIIDEIPFEPFDIKLKGYGTFGSLFWVGIEKSDRLENYVKRLRRKLAENHIPHEWGNIKKNCRSRNKRHTAFGKNFNEGNA